MISLRYAMLVLSFLLLCGQTLFAQKVELAKVALGMSEQEAKTSIGPGYLFFQQQVGGFPNLKYVFAANGNEATGYSFAFLNGKVEAFSFSKHFLEGNYPLQKKLYESVAAKLWEPVQQPNGSTWISDAQGHPLVNSSADRALLTNCLQASNWTDTGLLRNNIHVPQNTLDVLKTLMQPNIEGSDPRCGETIQFFTTNYFANQALVMHTGLHVKNVLAFSQLAHQAVQKRDAEKQSETKKAAAGAPSPF